MRWAIITGSYNAADLVSEFCSYYLGLGADKIFVGDYGSNDGTLDLLAPFIRTGHVQLVPLPTHHFADYDPSNAILNLIRKEDAADWVSFLDPDEFLAGPGNMKAALVTEWSSGHAAIALPRFNLTGVGPLPPQVHYLQHLTLKILATEVRVPRASAPLSSPWIFSRLPPKVMIRVQSNLTTITGDHNVVGAAQEIPRSSSLEILHLPVRSYEAFEEKIDLVREYFAKNPEFSQSTAWHWRRWVELFQSGQLREEYEKQFLEDAAAKTLLDKGHIVPERHLADWWANTQAIER